MSGARRIADDGLIIKRDYKQRYVLGKNKNGPSGSNYPASLLRRPGL